MLGRWKGRDHVVAVSQGPVWIQVRDRPPPNRFVPEEFSVRIAAVGGTGVTLLGRMEAAS